MSTAPKPTPGLVINDRPLRPLPPGVTASFTHLCHICGITVHIVDGQTQPHVCRVEVGP